MLTLTRKKKPFVTGYCHNSDHAALKKWKKYFGKHGYVFYITIPFRASR